MIACIFVKIILLFIIQGQFAPVKGNYSATFKLLIRDLLQRDPDLRPTAAEILHRKLPPVSKAIAINFFFCIVR